MNKNHFMIGWIILQIVALGSWAGLHEWQRQHAPRVLLKLRPVDPYDILRGRYQRVGFDIEQVPSAIVEGSKGFDRANLLNGDPVWLVLAQGTNEWCEVISIHREHPKNKDLVVRSKYTWDWSDYTGGTNRVLGIQVSLGIDRYFIPNQHGDIPRGTNQVVLGEVSVGKAGNPQLERLLIDGKTY